MQFTDYIPTINTLRNVLDIALVFIIVYVVLKLLRGTRAVPTVVGMVILALLYWFAAAQEMYYIAILNQERMGSGRKDGIGSNLHYCESTSSDFL